MSSKYSFNLQSEDPKRQLPRRLIIGCQPTETTRQVLLKLLGYLLFHRERLLMEPRLEDDNIPFRPHLAQLDYQMQVRLWVECGDCPVQKLDKLAVKVPEAEIWVLKSCLSEVEELILGMRKGRLRKNRYNLIGLDSDLFDELLGRVGTRNEVFWVDGSLDPPLMQFDFNGLWFELEGRLIRF